MRERNASKVAALDDVGSVPVAGNERRPAVLVVDDERANRTLLRASLASTYDVYEADSGEGALALMAACEVDLMLLDVMMPGMGGLELCRHVKQSRTDYLPVILLTALGRQGDRNAGLEAGADDFVSKPFDRHELLLRVRTFTRLREQEQRIRRQLLALREQEQVIARQVAQLQALDAMKDDLVSMMVHDLRNPLAGVSGFLGLLIEDAQDDETRQEATIALEASGRIREILDDLLCVRMLESGSLPLRRESVHIDTLLRDAIGSLSGFARVRGVELAGVNDGEDLILLADAKLIRRAIENLLSNAIKYSPDGGMVRATVRRRGDDLEIEVADRGCGIPDELKSMLFQKFGSIEAARGEVRRGVGLGLYLVSLVAAAHGGRTGVRDRQHGGAAFGLYLPAPKESASLIKVAS